MLGCGVGWRRVMGGGGAVMSVVNCQLAFDFAVDERIACPVDIVASIGFAVI